MANRVFEHGNPDRARYDCKARYKYLRKEDGAIITLIALPPLYVSFISISFCFVLFSSIVLIWNWNAIWTRPFEQLKQI